MLIKYKMLQEIEYTMQSSARRQMISLEWHKVEFWARGEGVAGIRRSSRPVAPHTNALIPGICRNV